MRSNIKFVESLDLNTFANSGPVGIEHSEYMSYECYKIDCGNFKKE